MKKTQLTKEGFAKLQQEYKELIEKKKPYSIDRLQKARGMGDLSENSEYSAAKDELAFVEGRIQEIDEILKNVEIVANHFHSPMIEVGSKIVVEVNNQRDEFEIVGEFEADPALKKISQTSPIGKALLGKKVGETTIIKVPAGEITYKILEIK